MLGNLLRGLTWIDRGVSKAMLGRRKPECVYNGALRTRGGDARRNSKEFSIFVCGRYPSVEGLHRDRCHVNVSDYLILRTKWQAHQHV